MDTVRINKNLTLSGKKANDGIGMPVAWMLASSGTEITVSFFLRKVREASPTVTPGWIMSDKDRAQMNAIEAVFPESRLVLCWWHVLHAWRQHFKTQHHEKLWEKLRAWVRVSDVTEFDQYWREIQKLAPESVVTYLETHWMPIQEKWSAIPRKARSIFSDSDTNMLLEAWHHTLKTTFLASKPNRRIDHLIYTLVEEVIPYFRNKHLGYSYGLAGLDVRDRAIAEAKKRGSRIPVTDIFPVSTRSAFRVISQENRELRYEVTLRPLWCTCDAFPGIEYCKHVFAVSTHFPHLEVPAPDPIPFAPTLPPAPKAATPSSASQSIPGILQTLETITQIVKHAGTNSLPPCVEGPLAELKLQFDGALAVPGKKRSISPNQGTDFASTKQNMGFSTNPNSGLSVKTTKLQKRKFTDPYAGGEQSGKRAKPDAANAKLTIRIPPASQPLPGKSTFTDFPASQPLPNLYTIPPDSPPTPSRLPHSNFPATS